ncbi:MAG: S9 family peptidase, partial [Anaerolineae bacterium]
GGAFAVANSVVFFSNFADQRVYRLEPGGQPRPLTPDGLWYADGEIESPPARRSRAESREAALRGETES